MNNDTADNMIMLSYPASTNIIIPLCPAATNIIALSKHNVQCVCWITCNDQQQQSTKNININIYCVY
jgi:hypothetical protein